MPLYVHVKDQKTKVNSKVLPRVDVKVYYLTAEHSEHPTTQSETIVSFGADGKFPQSIVIGRGGELISKPFENANYTLVDILPYYIPTDMYTLDIRGSATSTFCIGYQNQTYVYYKHDQKIDFKYMDTIVTINNIMCGEYEFYYNAPINVVNITIGILKEGKTSGVYDEDKLIRKFTESKFINVSAEHQQHFRPEHIWSVLDKSERAKIGPQLNRLGVNIGAAGYSGVMLWLLSLDEMLYELVTSTCLLDSVDYYRFDEIGKIISIRAKRLQNVLVEDVKTLFEANVLVNRVAVAIDWEQEKKNRLEPNLAQLSPEYVYNAAVNVFKTPLNEEVRFKTATWEKFWETRWEWCTAGAVHSQIEEDKKYISSERDFKNKFVTVNAMPETTLAEMLQTKPEINCRASIKYEWGKQRAIYGTDLRSYIITTFALANCEDLLPNQFLIGNQSRESLVAAKLSSVLHDRVPFCLDFQDFNSQHSNENMKAVLLAFFKVHGDKLSEEQRLAFAWVLESVDNTVIHDNIGTHSVYNSRGTLMSGWRLTSWMNSICNYIYLSALVDKSYNNSRSVHSGDDILYAVSNLKQVTHVIKKARQYNIRLSRKKCNFASVAEFLRVDHAAGTYGQYLPRGIATLVHSRMESKPAYDIRDIAEAMIVRFREYVNRGGNNDLAIRLRDEYFSRISKEWTNNRVDMNIFNMVHRVCGGVSDDPCSAVDHKIVRSIRRMESGGIARLDLPMPGIQAYAKFIQRTSIIPLELGYIAKYIRKRTVEAFIRLSVQYELRELDKMEQTQYKVYRGIYRAHSRIKSSEQYGRAKVIGKAVEILQHLTDGHAIATVITDRSRALETLSIII